MHRLSRLCAAVMLAGCCTVCAVPAASADAGSYDIPTLGTAGVLGLTVQKEEQIGDFFMRTARSMMPVIDDPVLTEYVTSVGNKLLMHADHVNFPFEFFVVNDPTLNASAFLGGKVRVNTGLFTYCDTEDEFASVLAHEISHVTQRHIARFLEGQAQRTNLTLASIIGAVAMSIINPTFGMAALSTTMGVSAQSNINFTRDNEYEADRIGLSLLSKSGFNPAGMTDLFRKLLSMQGNINPAFTLLIDHPLSEIRVAEASNRVSLLPRAKDSSNPDFYLAKARAAVRYGQRKDYADYMQVLKSGRAECSSSVYINYALALCAYELKQYDEAEQYLNALHLPNNLFVLDLLTDLDVARHRYDKAIARLDGALRRMRGNRTLTANLASACIETGQYSRAQKLLESYDDKHPHDVVMLDLLTKAYGKQNRQCDLMQTRGELFAQYANYSQSIYMFNQALRVCPQYLTQEKIKARVAQIANQRAFDEELSKM